MLRPTFMWKDGDSQVDHCPALYDAASDLGVPGYVVQGKQLHLKADDRPGFVVYGQVLTADEMSFLRDLDVDESAVWVSADDLAARAVPDSEPLRPAQPGDLAVWVPEDVLDLTRTPA